MYLAFARIVTAVLALLATVAFSQDISAPQSVLPELGDTSSVSISPQMERRIGEEAMREIRRDPAYVDDPEILDYLNSLGSLLVSASGVSRQDFEFFAIQDSSINAFAMPGGFIGVNTGLILAAQTESELASVLAHEISHVTQHHIARSIGKQNQLSVVSIAGALLGILAARNSSQAGQAVMLASQAGTVQARLGYSRDFEREADRVGLDVLKKAGFDVTGMVAFFERLQKASRLNEVNAPAYLQSHPLSVERISDIQNRSQEATYRQRVDKVDFQFVRSKIRAEQGAPQEAVAYFEVQLREKRFGSETAAHYGLANALLRLRDFARAKSELDQIAQIVKHPALDLFAARVMAAKGELSASAALLKVAAARQPGYRPLQYALVQAQQRLGSHAEALDNLANMIRLSPRDWRLFSMQASSYAATGKGLLQHQAQAEVYILQGSMSAAAEQLQIALKAGDGDFYQLSSVEAKLRQLRAKMIEEQRLRQ